MITFKDMFKKRQNNSEVVYLTPNEYQEYFELLEANRKPDEVRMASMTEHGTGLWFMGTPVICRKNK